MQGGVYTSKQHECDIVRDYLDEWNVDYLGIEQCPNSDAADVIVDLADGITMLFEVKEEMADRWMRYHQLGIDGISSFQFSNSGAERYWKQHPYSPSKLAKFMAAIDGEGYYKEGKIEYSSADVWLFAGYNAAGDYDYLEGFWGDDIQSEEFKGYLKARCDFAVNQKNHDASAHDSWCSMCWYVNPADMPAAINWFDEGYCKPMELWRDDDFTN